MKLIRNLRNKLKRSTLSSNQGQAQESQNEEIALVAKARAGDRQAYRVLVERYQQRVYAIAYQVLKNQADAEDVAQEAFVKAFLSLKSFRGESSFFTWLYRITHHMALDYRRSLMRRKSEPITQEMKKEDAVGVQLVTEKPSDDPGQVFSDKELAVRLKKALEKISEEHRSVVVLREVDGLSYEEIAEATGVSKGTVMSRLFYARKKLQEALADYV
jgi:RNA polymerase sigma-70 factor (ECF subfamily)